jgi:hypothetical protein
MRTLAIFSAIFSLLAAGCATQPDSASRAVVMAPNHESSATADCEWSRTKDDFGATVVFTPEAIWKARRGAVAREVPPEHRADFVRVGGKVWGLIYLTNPQPDGEGSVNVTCDVRTIRPNGKVTVHRELCALRRKAAGRGNGTYLSEFVVTMEGEDNDPLGEWVIEIVVHDRNRNVDVPIVGRFKLLPRDRRVAVVCGGAPRS